METTTSSNMQRALLAPGSITRNRHRDRYRRPMWWSGFETYGDTQFPFWKTSGPSRKNSNRCIVTTTVNLTSQWSEWPTSFKERINCWESTRIESKQIGDQQVGSCRRTRSLTKWLGADYDQDIDSTRNCWPQTTEDSTQWKSFSTTLRIPKSSRTAKAPTTAATSTAKAVKRMISTRLQETQHLTIYIWVG